MKVTEQTKIHDTVLAMLTATNEKIDTVMAAQHPSNQSPSSFVALGNYIQKLEDILVHSPISLEKNNGKLLERVELLEKVYVLSYWEALEQSCDARSGSTTCDATSNETTSHQKT